MNIKDNTMWQMGRAKQARSQRQFLSPYALLLSTLLSLLLISCTGNTEQKASLGTSSQEVNYKNSASDVVIRTYYGGGTKGSLSFGPQLTIYGDGTYILGLEKQGKMEASALEELLRVLVDTNGLLKMKRQQFSDIPDQNATFLQLTLNDKTYEYMYGPFGNHPQRPEDIEEYRNLEKALTTINQFLKGETKPYKANDYVLLARYTKSYEEIPPSWFNVGGLELFQVAVFECGDLYDKDDNDPNKENGCLKYTVPKKAVLLTNEQKQSIQQFLNNQLEGRAQEGENQYAVKLRPLLPDEMKQKTLAMFGSGQIKYQKVTLHQGAIPPQKWP